MVIIKFLSKYSPIAGNTGVFSFAAISLLNASRSLVTSLDTWSILVQLNERIILLLVYGPHSSCPEFMAQRISRRLRKELFLPSTTSPVNIENKLLGANCSMAPNIESAKVTGESHLWLPSGPAGTLAGAVLSV